MALPEINDAIDEFFDEGLEEIMDVEGINQYKFDFGQTTRNGELYGILKLYLNENGLSEDIVLNLRLISYNLQSVERDKNGQFYGLFETKYDI